MRKVNYKEKGITLIALVVTIIILLILAGVTLTTALSQNGLFQRAKIAGENYKKAEADETEKLGEVEKEIDKIVNGETPPDPPSSGIGSSDIAEDLKEYQGKYVDIGLDTNDDKQVNDWEIFYVNEDRIFLIAADYVPVENLKKWGVIDGTLKSNGFIEYSSSSKYSVGWSTPTTFLNEGLADLNLVMHNGYYLKGLTSASDYNSIAVSHLLNKTAWEGVKNAAGKKTSIDFVIGGPTLEMWCAAWNKAVAEDETLKQIQADDVGASGYYLGCEATSLEQKFGLCVNGTEYSNPSSNEIEKYKAFFPHTAIWRGCYGYWLASPSAEKPENLLSVYFGGLIRSWLYNNHVLGVRPVVSLVSGVRIEERADVKNVYDLEE